MSAISNAIVAFFTTIVTMCSALNRFASAVDSIGQVAEESAAAYADEARVQRKLKANALNRELAASDALPQLPTA
jgi:hypothetical protein